MPSTWPSTLPHPKRDGYQVSGELPVVRTAMEGGRARVHRVTSTIMRNISVSVVLDKKQANTFWSFFNVDANAGADFVYVPVITGNAIKSHLCRFTSYPNEAVNGLVFEISFSLETDEQYLEVM